MERGGLGDLILDELKRIDNHIEKALAD